MELNERDLAWIVIIFYLFYMLGTLFVFQITILDEKIPSYSLRFEKAIKRVILSFAGLFLLLLILSLLHTITDYKVLDEIPKVWSEFEKSF